MQGYDEAGNKIEGGLKTYGTTTITDMEYTSEVERYSSSYVDYTENPQLKTKSGDSYLFDKFGQTKKLQ